MGNRMFEMYHYRQVIHRMRMGQSDRVIAQVRLMGRAKCAQVRAAAEAQGWLGEGPLPDDTVLSAAIERPSVTNPTHQSLSLLYEVQIRQWVEKGILGAATIDRLHHAAYKVVLDGKSYREAQPDLKSDKPTCQRTTKSAPQKGDEIH